jgi:hypothetical protein
VPAQKNGTGTPLPVPFSADHRAGTASEWQSPAFPPKEALDAFLHQW